MKLKIIIGLIVLALLIGCTQRVVEGEGKGAEKSVVVPKANTAEDEYIVIGFSDALTGGAASYGQVSKAGTEIAVEEINAKGGVNGKKLKLIYEDNQCDGKTAATVAEKLVSLDKVKVVLGGSCSGAVMSSAPIFEKAKVVLLEDYASSPNITNAGDYIFRTSYSDADTGKAAAELFTKKFKKVAILSENTEFAQAYKKVAIDTFKNLGGEIVADEVFQKDSRDFKTEIAKAMQAKPELIWADPQIDVTGGIAVKQLRELGWEGPIYSNFATPAPGFLETAGSAAEGIVFIADPEVAEGSSKWTNVLEKYRQKYQKEPAYNYPLASSYDNVYIIAKAIGEVGLDADKIKEWLYEMPEFEGALGKYRFDDNGDVTGVKPVIKVIKDGKPVPYEE